jgi:hypothetical protein
MLTAFVTTAFAGDIQLRAPRSLNSDVSASSFTGTVDDSLLKFTVFFDGLDHSYGALMYDVAEITNIFDRPIRLAMAGAVKDDQQSWFGVALNYDLVSTERIRFGVATGFPGVNLDGSTLTLEDTPFDRAVVGVYGTLRF